MLCLIAVPGVLLAKALIGQFLHALLNLVIFWGGCIVIDAAKIGTFVPSCLIVMDDERWGSYDLYVIHTVNRFLSYDLKKKPMKKGKRFKTYRTNLRNKEVFWSCTRCYSLV